MIQDYLQSFNILTPAEIDDFIALAHLREINKGDFFIQEGKICREVAFVNSGIVRTFFTQESGEEVTYCITFPGSLLTAYSSYITAQPTVENIQAVTSTELLVIPKAPLTALTQSSVNWVTFLKIMAEQQYIELEKRLLLFQKEKAKKRYLDLLVNQPDYIRQIPLQYLASYLGITARHLSRLRKEILL